MRSVAGLGLHAVAIIPAICHCESKTATKTPAGNFAKIFLIDFLNSFTFRLGSKMDIKDHTEYCILNVSLHYLVKIWHRFDSQSGCCASSSPINVRSSLSVDSPLSLSRQPPYISPSIFHSWLLNKPREHCRKSAATTCVWLIHDHWRNKRIVNCRIVKLTVSQMPFGRRSAANSEPWTASITIFSAITIDRTLYMEIESSIISNTVHTLRLKECELQYRRITGADFLRAMGACNSTQRIGLSRCGWHTKKNYRRIVIDHSRLKTRKCAGGVKYQICPRSSRGGFAACSAI